MNRPLLITPERVLEACDGLQIRQTKTGRWVSDLYARDKVLAGFGVDPRDYLDDDPPAKLVIDTVHAEEVRLVHAAERGHQ